jgi:hypothetical protein
MNCYYPILDIPVYRFKIKFFKLVISIELILFFAVEVISDQAIVFETVSNCDEIFLKKFPSSFVHCEHKLLRFLIVNMHQDIKCQKGVVL